MLWACAIFLLLASAAGFATGRGWWKTGSDDPPSAAPPAAAERRAAAFRLVDEAVTARHEERMQGAVNAIAEARRLAPDLPGLDIFVGEVAWERRDAGTVRRAALEAADRGYNRSAAKLLLALERWMTRSGQDPAILGESVRQLLGEAEDASPSNAAPFFFHGEVSRLLADGAEAHRKLIGALHRQTPWAGALLLETKLQLAAAEAAGLGRPVVVPAPTDAANSVLSLRVSLLGGDDLCEPLAKWLASSPALQTAFLMQDPALMGVAAAIEPQVVRGQTQPAVPNAGMFKAHTF